MGSVVNGSSVNGGTPPYGRRLIPQVIDDFAAREPQREAFQIPRSDTDPKAGWRVVTFGDFAAAIDRCAHRIVERCGPAPEGKFPTIAYIGAQDARYAVLAVAAAKAGYKALFTSPRNSQEAHLNLFDKTDCNVLWYAPSLRAAVEPWLKHRAMKTHEVEPAEEWLAPRDAGPKPVPPFPYTKTFEQAEWDPFCVLHTSGSTGLPKPIDVKNGMLAVSDSHRNIPDWRGSTIWIKKWGQLVKRLLAPFPMFHAAGCYLFFFDVVFLETPVALGLPGKPLSAEMVYDCLNNVDVDGAALPPSILEDLSQDEEHIKALAKLNMVACGGGNLVRDAGDRLARNGVNLVNLIAATEFAGYPIYLSSKPDPALWQYFHFNSDLFGGEWRKASDGDDESGPAYELVIVRRQKEPGLQGIFYTFPELSEYPTKDLYRPHPTLPDYWIHCGRADDIMVFSNGEKLNPVTIEETVQDHPQVKGVVVVGVGKFQPGLLLEPLVHPKTKDEESAFVDAVWPLVEKANRETVAHGQIARHLVMVSSADKPFARAGKGTIQRAATVKLYADEIDRLFAESGGPAPGAEVAPVDVSSEAALARWIADTLEEHAQAPRIEADTNFFAAGIDSRQIINFAGLLRTSLVAAGFAGANATTVGPRPIYSHPTPQELAQYILQTIVGGKSSAQGEEEREIAVMKELVDKYTRDPIQGDASRPGPSATDQTVVLTGSTGALGSYLLDQLVRSKTVKSVVCLNRAADGGAAQQAKAMAERGLARDYTSKASFFHADLSLPDLALPADVYERLLRDADRIVHNGWPVNFNISTRTFEPHVRGVRHLADLAAKAARRVAVVFISSIGSVDRWDRRRGPVPEARMEDWSLPGGGYGRSKMVGSLVLEAAAGPGNFPAAVIRVGQIGGPEAEGGAWNRHEWLPSIVASSLHLHALPADLGAVNRVDWTPVERIAGLVLDVAGTDGQGSEEGISGYYHGVNPSATTWDGGKLAAAVAEFYGPERIRELVPFSEWIDRLAASQAATDTSDAAAVAANPGLKLIDSYRGMTVEAAMAASGGSGSSALVCDMTRTCARSQTIREASAVTPKLMKHWCAQWGF